MQVIHSGIQYYSSKSSVFFSPKFAALQRNFRKEEMRAYNTMQTIVKIACREQNRCDLSLLNMLLSSYS